MLDVSDPPYYSACPNPFIQEYLRVIDESRPTGQHIVPAYDNGFEVDRRHPVYNFHPYHTKVPPEIIRGLIEHYTRPGELILDGFCGSGMTGVAAREAGRHALLFDLSPAATFIAGANVIAHNWNAALQVLNDCLYESRTKWGYIYETTVGRQRIEANYFVWSDVFTCPDCGKEFPFFPHGVIHHGTKVETRDSFPCPYCASELNVRRVRRVIEDERKKRQLVWVNAGRGPMRVNREPSEADIEHASQFDTLAPTDWYPTDPIDPSGYSAKLAQLGDKAISDVSRLLSPRNLIVFADLWARVGRIEDASMRHICRATLSSIFTVVSERQGYFGGGGGMSGNLYMPIVRMEKNVYDVLSRKLVKLADAEQAKERATGTALVSTQSSTDLGAVPDETVDYIYIDPPFGANIIYSEANRVLEGWLRVRTNDEPEAVVDTSRNRDLDAYSELLRHCFSEFFRVLKPGHWMTVEFHNTFAETWNAIQTEIGMAGFELVQIGILDKGSTTILSDIRPSSAKHDLIISAQKPLQRRPPTERSHSSPAADWIWEFLADRLATPLEPKERRREMLFNRVVAECLQRGVDVPVSAAAFTRGLEMRFTKVADSFYLPGAAPDKEGSAVTSDLLSYENP